jgi:hypothetical protein
VDKPMEIPQAADPEAATVHTFELPPSYLKSTVTTQITAHPGVPLEARAFARILTAQIQLLESLDREVHGGKKKTVWTMSEAAIIGERGAFTVTGICAESYKKAMREGKAKSKATAGSEQPR